MMLLGHCVVQYTASRSKGFFSQEEASESSVVYPLFTSGINTGANPSLWACACMCVHSKRQAWLSSARRRKSKDSGLVAEDARVASNHPYTARRMHTQSKKGAALLTISLTGPHVDEHTAGSRSKNNPAIYLNPHVSLYMWVDSPL